MGSGTGEGVWGGGLVCPRCGGGGKVEVWVRENLLPCGRGFGGFLVWEIEKCGEGEMVWYS